MPTLPRSESSLLVRTDFTSDDAWQQLCARALEENRDGFRAYIEPVSDPDFDHATWIQVKAAVPGDSHKAAVLFVGDSTTLTSPEHPVLVVDLLNGGPTLPCIAAQLWKDEDNLTIANMYLEALCRCARPHALLRSY